MKNCYSEGSGKYQEQYNCMWNKLVPKSGKCESQEGELLRAVTRICYDYTNNGFGNDWSGAYNFLDEYLGLTKSFRNRVGKYRHGNRLAPGTFKGIDGTLIEAYSDGDPILCEINSLIDRIVEFITSREKLSVLTPNTCDMFDLTDKHVKRRYLT